MDANNPAPAQNELHELVSYVSNKVKTLFGREDEPYVVVSPYRFNPLGAHIDHQGGAVLARTLNQYTILAFYPLETSRIVLHCHSGDSADKAVAFDIGATDCDQNWARYAMASASTFTSLLPKVNGFSGLVYGSLLGAGLSSSASVVLAYLAALASANQLTLSKAEQIDMVRQVENDHMGLNNGLQDQMSIVFGQSHALSLLHMDSVSATYIDNPDNIEDVRWVLCYSGFDRELVSSGFNDRVRECREAASLLDADATVLGDVSISNRTKQKIDALPVHLGRRAMHVYGEMDRVAKGAAAWADGDWSLFGDLMNQSCQSSIVNYECGSDPMVELRNIALKQADVYGSRFSGGGYGGCLIMLVKEAGVESVENEVLSAFLARYPEKQDVAKTFVGVAEQNVRTQPKRKYV